MVVSLNGKKYDCPECYEQLTVEQHQRIIAEWDHDKPLEERDFFKLFCILTGTDFKSFHATTENETTIWNLVRWVIDQPFKFSDEVPKVLEIGGKILSIPNNLGDLSIGQNIHLRQLLDKSKALFDKEGNVLEFEVYSKAVAIYLQPLYDGDRFSYDSALELEKEVLKMKAWVVRPVGFFLLLNAWKSGRGQKKGWQKIPNNLTGILRRAWPNWLGGSVYSLSRMLG